MAPRPMPLGLAHATFAEQCLRKNGEESTVGQSLAGGFEPGGFELLHVPPFA